MGTVASYDMASIQSALGGSNPISLSEYYRGGSYVPATVSGAVREPASGEYNIVSNPGYSWNYTAYGDANVAASAPWIIWPDIDGAGVNFLIVDVGVTFNQLRIFTINNFSKFIQSLLTPCLNV